MTLVVNLLSRNAWGYNDSDPGHVSDARGMPGRQRELLASENLAFRSRRVYAAARKAVPSITMLDGSGTGW